MNRFRMEMQGGRNYGLQILYLQGLLFYQIQCRMKEYHILSEPLAAMHFMMV